MSTGPWTPGQLRSSLVDLSASVTAAAADHALNDNAAAARALVQVADDLNEILRHWDIVTVTPLAAELIARASA